MASITTSTAFAQTKPEKVAPSSCSNIVALTGDANINCSSLTPEQQKLLKEIPPLLRQILSNQVDVPRLKTEMDAILKLVESNANSAWKDQQHCEAGSLCNQDSEINAPQTVQNNFGPKARHLTDDQKTALLANLQGKVIVMHFGYLSDVPDAHDYAVELCNAVRAAISSTTCEGDTDIWAMANESGASDVGIQVSYKGDPIPAGRGQTKVAHSFDSPIGAVIKAFAAAGIDNLTGHPTPTLREDEITVVVGAVQPSQ